MFNEFWTYKGSLTSPPCTEGIRWFVARNVLFVSVEQMQAILAVSTYSARVEQEVWRQVHENWTFPLRACLGSSRSIPDEAMADLPVI